MVTFTINHHQPWFNLYDQPLITNQFAEPRMDPKYVSRTCNSWVFTTTRAINLPLNQFFEQQIHRSMGYPAISTIFPKHFQWFADGPTGHWSTNLDRSHSAGWSSRKSREKDANQSFGILKCGWLGIQSPSFCIDQCLDQNAESKRLTDTIRLSQADKRVKYNHKIDTVSK